MTTDASLTNIPQFLEQLRHEHFYGRVSFDLRDGEVALIRTERTQLVSPKASTKTHQGANRDEYQPADTRK
jgi:hypothetical protein